MSVKRNNSRRNASSRWVAGDVLSWVLGVTLGVVLGVVLLIVAPRLGNAQGEATPAPEGTIAAPAQTTEGASEAGGDGAQASGQGGGDTLGTDTTSVAGQTGAAATVEPTGNTSADRARAQGEIGTSTAQNTGPEDAAAAAIDSAGAGAAGAAGGTQNGQMDNMNMDGGTGPQSGGAAASGAAPAGTATAGDAAAGQTVYVSNCSGCHGANGQGVVGPSLVTANGPKSWTLAQFTTTLREGRTPERELNATMPRFSEAQLSDAQVADLFAYIKTLN
jgi:mono/diheme cytochrome c family protein